MALLGLALVLAALQPVSALAAGEAARKTALSRTAADDSRAGILRLMDRVIADPSDEQARKELRLATGLAVEKERRGGAAEGGGVARRAGGLREARAAPRRSGPGTGQDNVDAGV